MVKRPEELRGKTWTTIARELLEARGERVRHDADEALLIRDAYSLPEGAELIASTIGAQIAAGAASEADTTLGWTRRVDLPSYVQTALGKLDVAPRLESIGRGQAAPVISAGVTIEQWRLAKFGAQFQLGEEDFLSGRAVDTFLLALEEIGRAASRVLPDLVYSVLLENPALADGTALFHATRSNLGAAALADTALDAAMAAIGNQTLTDVDGLPIHRGMAAKYLIVPPDLQGLGHRLNADMDGVLEVRGESRLSATGVVDPRDGETLRKGAATVWMLAAPASQVASIAVGALGGNFAPRVRTGELDRGAWGYWADVSLSLAVCPLDPSGLYFAAP